MIQHISHTVATMSKVKAKKADSSAKTQPVQTAEKNSTAKQKRKQWMKEKFRKKKLHPKDQQKANAQQTVPPKDAQQFSANWKTLQEMLKVSQEDKKTVHQPKQQNGDLLKKGAEESSSKTLTKNDVSPGQTDTGKKWKHKTLSNNSVTEDPQVKVTEPGQAAAPKRKRDDGIRVSEKTAKKKSSAVEERKPTEDDLWFDDVDPDDVEATMGAEAADIMRKMQGVKSNINKTESSLVKDKAFEGLTRAVAIDCEMVGVGPDGEDSILARVSLVNQFGKCIYDKHVKPTEKVTDYRTAVSGIRPKDIREGEDVQTVQKEVAEILEGRIVVGHAIHNDLKILLLDHPKKKIRDTQKYKPFRKTVKSNRPSLKVLCREILNVNVQQGEHSSVQDAQATMRLYTLEKKQWEAEIKASQKNKESDRKFDRKPRFPKNKDKKLIGR